MEKKIAIYNKWRRCSGMNAAIRAAAKAAMAKGMKVYGVQRGYLGMLNDEIFPMDSGYVSGIIDRGGTRSINC